MSGKRPKLGVVFSGDSITKLPTKLSGERTADTPTELVSPERIVQLNVAVPESLRRQVKIKALQSGKDLNIVIKEILIAWMEE